MGVSEEEEEAAVEESAAAEDVMKALLKAVLRAVVKTAVREEEDSDSSVVVVVVVVGLGMSLMEAAKDAGEGTELVSDDVGGRRGGEIAELTRFSTVILVQKVFDTF